MKTKIALIELAKVANRKVSDFGITDKVNKGSAGLLLERIIGLEANASLKDLEDGEIKTFKVVGNIPAETIAISMVQHQLNEIANNIEWELSILFNKISSIIFVAVHKDTDDWYYSAPITISNDTNTDLYNRLKEDYNYVCERIRNNIRTNTYLSTYTGPNNFLQIRTKGNKKKDGSYSSNHFGGVNISKAAPYAFYFTKNFVKEIYE